ncbi:MAG: tripartite tricarboxylate transporter substrate binding protein [Betaproteobacteria bacterium]|nr:tripartite tricarboxylate transporter substrate binding protein [Betaproteobacteria bacterium]
MGQGRHRHRHARGIAAALSLLLVCAQVLAASAEKYPARPLRMIVPATPGATSDVLGRIVAMQLSAAFGQQVIVDNRPGAGSVIGTDLVAKAAPDGYTLVMIYTSHTTNASLQKLPYDPVADFAPITMLTSAPLVLIVPATSNIASVKELIATGKAQPLTYGSAGVGSGGHLAGELFRTVTGIQATHVPYKGAAPAAIDVAGGQLGFQFASQITIQPLLAGKRVRMLAVTSAKRAASLADVPSLVEAGLSGFEVLNWFGVAAPARTPPAIVAALNAAIVKSLRVPDVRDKLTSEGSEIVANTPQEFTAFLQRDIARWAQVIKAAGVKL